MRFVDRRLLIGIIGLGLLLTLNIRAGDNQSGQAKTIDEAIKKGVAWLKIKQIKEGDGNGSWGKGRTSVSYPGGTGGQTLEYEIGITGLALYALFACELSPAEPVIKNAFTFIETNLSKGMEATTYERAMVLLALEALADTRAKKKIAQAGGKTGGKITFLLSNEKQLAESQIRWLEAAQSAAGGWRYLSSGPFPGGFNEDVSQTQVALLGLKAAARLGFTIEKTTFLSALNYILTQQEKDGPVMRRTIQSGNPAAGTKKEPTFGIREATIHGWAYVAASKEVSESIATGSMTAAGICSLIICKSELLHQPLFTKPLQEQTEKSINDGLAWMETHYTVTTNPGGTSTDWGYYYYLYGLERVGRLGNTMVIGSHNWYLEGSELLLKKQHPEGCWMAGRWWEEGADVIDTSFALLFLKQATKPVLTK